MLDNTSKRKLNVLKNVERDLAREIIRPHVIVVKAAPAGGKGVPSEGTYRLRPGISLSGLCERIRPDVPHISVRQVEYILDMTWGHNLAKGAQKLAQAGKSEPEQTTAQLRARVRTLEQDLANLKREVQDLRAMADYLGWDGRSVTEERQAQS